MTEEKIIKLLRIAIELTDDSVPQPFTEEEYGEIYDFLNKLENLCELSTDNKEKLDVLKFIRKETCCGLAEANNALLKLIKVLKEHPLPIMDKPHKLKIEWEE